MREAAVPVTTAVAFLLPVCFTIGYLLGKLDR
jgi:hypothetical protein